MNESIIALVFGQEAIDALRDWIGQQKKCEGYHS